MSRINTSLLFPDVPEFRVHSWRGDDMILQLIRYVRIGTSAGWVTVPTGFITDGLSIPKWARPMVGPATGRAFLGGILHDYLYSPASDRNFKVDRKTADLLFLEAMTNLNIGPRRFAIYAAVRAFGWRFFKKRNYQRGYQLQ
jgi:hypothetical protein